MVIEKKNTSSLEINRFLKEILLNNKLIIFCLIILSLITSYFLFAFQSQVLSVNKNLRAINFISSTNLIYKKIFVDPNEILEEYISVLRLGINKEDFHNLIENNQNIDVTFDNFEKFRKNLVMDDKRSYNRAPLYSIYYLTEIEINFRDKFHAFKNRDEIFLETALIRDKEFIKYLKIIDEIVKFKILNYIKDNNAMVDADLSEKNIDDDYHLTFKVDNSEIRLFKNANDNQSLISNYNYDQVNQKYGFSKKSFIKGVNSFDYKVETNKFSEIFSMILFIFLTGFILHKIIRFKLT